MLKAYLIALLFAELIVLFLLPFLGVEVDQSLIIDLLKDTVSVSSFVFAVTGVWLGIANPRVMSELFRNGYSVRATKTESKKFSLIFLPLKYSIANICLSLGLLTVLRLSQNIEATNSPLLNLYENIMLMFTLMTNIILIFSILATVIPAYIIQQNAKTAAKKNDTFNQTVKSKNKP